LDASKNVYTLIKIDWKFPLKFNGKRAIPLKFNGTRTQVIFNGSFH
jgi:hypothetical protein